MSEAENSDKERAHQDDYIREYYPTQPTSEIAKKLGLPEKVIRCRANRRGLKKLRPSVRWGVHLEKTVRDLAAKGLTVPEIARKTGEKDKVIRAWVKRHGIEVTLGNESPWSTETKDLARNLFDLDYPSKEIAERIGRSTNAVRGWAHKNKLKFVRPKEWSDEHINQLKSCDPSMSDKEVQKKYFPDKTPTQVGSRRLYMGIRRPSSIQVGAVVNRVW